MNANGDIEYFVIRTKGGPFPGSRVVDSNLFEWPLPEILDMPEEIDFGGYYEKKNESSLPPQKLGSHLTTAIFTKATA